MFCHAHCCKLMAQKGIRRILGVDCWKSSSTLFLNLYSEDYECVQYSLGTQVPKSLGSFFFHNRFE